MKKIKLCGVSLCTLLAATGANAAGYTCEELIEYTSCMQGYYLNQDVSLVCPAGSYEVEDICDEGAGDIFTDWDEDYCEDDGGDWYSKACVMDGEVVEYQQVINAATCSTCPTGYTCDGGTAQPYVGACEPGYTKHTVCPGGWTVLSPSCVEGTREDDGSFDTPYFNGESKEDCLANGNDWLENYCEDLDGVVAPALVAGPTCGKCPAGYLCAGGDAAAVTCPAGSYCASAGLATPTGKCNVGTYSTGGAKSASCTSCPSTGLTDKDGKTVVATTAETGATAVSACIIGDKVEFKDTKGIYHFKSNCEYGFGKLTWQTTVSSADECEFLADQTGLDWQWSGNDECEFRGSADVIKSVVAFPQTESDCENVGASSYYWIDDECILDECSYWYFGDYGLSCE